MDVLSIYYIIYILLYRVLSNSYKGFFINLPNLKNLLILQRTNYGGGQLRCRF
ncbi:hypothetical protein ABID46_001037 [Moheibacter stercoris]|uniref:Uncharacterized protein n=1 Tax=Moheibacter stercoris TaxID=1628251 RepID=A0ABV2LSC1_9FLAO